MYHNSAYGKEPIRTLETLAKKHGYIVKICEPDNDLERNIKVFKPHIIFNALHGQFGEDG